MAKFRTRARAVDMLGRQQIAGIPNAISELFKNAHDAYADRVEADYFQYDNLFVLRDDGIGMTKEDFEDRWLTLATESKLEGGKNQILPPPNKTPRPIMGEKGIGRLAIAAIGRQVLVLTRAKRGNKLHDLVAAFIHWSLFEVPGVNLDEIEIPVQVFPGGTLPKREDIRGMVELVRQNLKILKDHHTKEWFDMINSDLDQFDFEPAELHEIIAEPSLLSKENGGTHFYILPASENLAADIEVDLKGEAISDLRKLLLGFSNTMVPNHKTPPIQTAFRYWQTYGQSTDLIGEQAFFTPNEFTEADHHIQGEFDEYGQFRGTVTVYNETAVEHIVSWPKALGKPVACGPLRINLAYVMGLSRESKLPPEEYVKITRKLDQIGGLYIYRDGIRILPYGNTQYDFLQMEERRGKHAAYYFFTYRRMCGAIEITRDKNARLVEKAGREGFQENKAYREFKEILINFFIQIAADFFRKGGKYTPTFEQKKLEKSRLELARREQEKHSAVARQIFANELEEFFDQINQDKIQEGVANIIKGLSEKLHAICTEMDSENGPNAILSAESAALNKLRALKKSHEIKKPTGIGFTKQMKRDWDSYLIERERLEKEVFAPAETSIRDIVAKTIKETKFEVSRAKHSLEQLKEFISKQQNELDEATDNMRATLKETDRRISDLIHETHDEIVSLMNEIQEEFKKINPNESNEEKINALKKKSEERLSNAIANYKEIFEHIGAQLKNINWSRSEDGYLIGEAEMKGALEDEVLALREQTEADVELAQLGMAIDIINHEFGNSVKSIRNNIRKLKGWADANAELQPLYNNIRSDFEHLDGYLTLFTPLNRRLNRQSITIYGSEIAKYLTDLFGERMGKDKVELIVSKKFREKTLEGYPSTFYPVFINLIENAMFWLKDRPEPRQIKLDVEDDSIVVSDNGPGIPLRDYEAVFELGFSRRPGGRGLGLFISRERLRKEGYMIELEKPMEGKGATFKICPKVNSQEN